MVEELFDDKKLIVVPKEIADRLTLVAAQRGSSVSNYTTYVLKEALRAEEMGADLKHAVDLYRLAEVHRGAGGLNITRRNLLELLGKLFTDHKEELTESWFNSGKWYGAYLSARFDGVELFRFLEKDLSVSWNLDEVEVLREDVVVSVRCVSFGMSLELTELLVVYLEGLFSELGYGVSEKDTLSGLLFFRFLRKM